MNKASYLHQEVNYKKKFTNAEIQLFCYFKEMTSVFPEDVIIHENFIFFFVKSKDYFKAKLSIGKIRKQLEHKKISIIRTEQTLNKLLFAFFPDLYIHDIKEVVKNNGKYRTYIIDFIDYIDRGVAVGRDGGYIKAVNAVFRKYICPIKIKCKFIVI